MIAVVANAEFLGNQVGNPLCGPDVRGVAAGDWPLEQKANEPVELPPPQTRRTSRHGLGPQGTRPAPAGGIAPTHHRAGVATHLPRHFRQRPAHVEQGQGAPPARLKRLCRSEWSHPGIPPRRDTSILHYLYRSQ